MLSKIKLLAIVLIASISMMACKKDKENPTIMVLEPLAGAECTWGSELHAECIFKDDRELASYHVFVGDEVGVVVPAFLFDYSGTTSGSSFTFHEHMIIPDSCETMYYLHFEITDAKDKTTSDKIMFYCMQ